MTTDETIEESGEVVEATVGDVQAKPDEPYTTKIQSMVAERGAGKSICPSEVARALAGSNEKEWRLLMKPIRAAAVALAKDGDITITRKGKPVDPEAFKGVYRLTTGSSPDQTKVGPS